MEWWDGESGVFLAVRRVLRWRWRRDGIEGLIAVPGGSDFATEGGFPVEGGVVVQSGEEARGGSGGPGVCDRDALLFRFHAREVWHGRRARNRYRKIEASRVQIEFGDLYWFAMR